MARITVGGFAIPNTREICATDDGTTLNTHLVILPRNSKDFTGSGIAIRSSAATTNVSIDFARHDGTVGDAQTLYFRGWIRIRRYPNIEVPILSTGHSLSGTEALVITLKPDGTWRVYNDGTNTGFGVLLGSIPTTGVVPPVPLMTWTAIGLWVKQNNAAVIAPDPPFESNAEYAITVAGATVLDSVTTGVGAQDGVAYQGINFGSGGPFGLVSRFRLGSYTAAGNTACDIDWSHIAVDNAAIPGDSRTTLVPVVGDGTYMNWPGGVTDWRARNLTLFPASVSDQAVSTVLLATRQSYLCDALADVGITGTILSATVVVFFWGQGGTFTNLKIFVRRNGIDEDSNAFTGPGSGSNFWFRWLFSTAGWLATDTIEIGVLSRSAAGTTSIGGMALLIEHDSPVADELPSADDYRAQIIQWTGTGLPQTITLPYVAHFLWWEPRANIGVGGGWWWNTMQTGHDLQVASGLVKPGFRVIGNTINMVDDESFYNSAGVVYDCLVVRDPKNRVHARGSFAQTAETTPVSTDNWDVAIGEGSGTNNITSFTPEALIMTAESALATTASYVRGPGHVGDLASRVSNTAAPIADRIQALQPTGFQAGSGGFDGNAFHFPFLGLRTTNFLTTKLFATTSYVGDGTASRLVGLDLDAQIPIWVWVIPHNAGNQRIRHTNSLSGQSYTLPDHSGSAVGITALLVNAITVGTDLNTTGVTYTVLAWAGGTDVPATPTRYTRRWLRRSPVVSG